MSNENRPSFLKVGKGGKIGKLVMHDNSIIGDVDLVNNEGEIVSATVNRNKLILTPKLNKLLQKNKDNRDSFMRTLYEMNYGSTVDYVDSHEIGKKIGLSNLSEISKIVSYLREKELIAGDFSAGIDANAYIALTPDGISFVENEEINLSGSFSPLGIQNTINIQGNFHGNLQSGETNTVSSPTENIKTKSGVITWLLEHIGKVFTGVLVVVILSWLGFKN